MKNGIRFYSGKQMWKKYSPWQAKAFQLTLSKKKLNYLIHLDKILTLCVHFFCYVYFQIPENPDLRAEVLLFTVRTLLEFF